MLPVWGKKSAACNLIGFFWCKFSDIFYRLITSYHGILQSLAEITDSRVPINGNYLLHNICLSLWHVNVWRTWCTCMQTLQFRTGFSSEKRVELGNIADQSVWHGKNLTLCNNTSQTKGSLQVIRWRLIRTWAFFRIFHICRQGVTVKAGFNSKVTKIYHIPISL